MLQDGWYTPKKMFDGRFIVEGGAFSVVDQKVAAVSQTVAKDAHKIDGLVTPGFVDLQVNGAGGALFNTDVTKTAFKAVLKAHRDSGTVAICPTLITDAPERMSAFTDAVLKHLDLSGVAGVHLEGPHLSVEKKGTHRASDIRPMDAMTRLCVNRLVAAGLPVIVTLAPEAVTEPEIENLVAAGAIVSIGHSNASFELTQRAVGAGATCFTHLFNAMSQLTAREPGVVGAALSSETYSSIICDGIHVSDEMIKLAMRSHIDPKKMFLVSDSMPTVGGPGSFSLYDRKIKLSNGKLVNSDGALAGAHTTMAEGLKRLVDTIGVPLLDALHMTISTPARMIGQDHLGQIIGRSTSDLIVLNEDLNPALVSSAVGV